MNVHNEYEFQEGVDIRPHWMVRSVEVPYETTSPAVDVLAGIRQPRRHGSRGPHAYNIHNEPDVAKRLVRMVEELLERDDALPDVDLSWYRNRLIEIKEEMSGGAQPVHDAEAGLGDRADAGVPPETQAVQGDGGALRGH